MKVEDLGELHGDVVLFGGIYSNLQAFEALLAWIKENDVSAQNCICTGDIVAYCANPSEVTGLMIKSGIRAIAGNCEVQLALGAQDCGCGFDEGTRCDLASKGWFPFAAVRTTAFRDDYAGLPDVITFQAYGKQYAVIHGGVTDVARFIWPVSDTVVFAEEIAAVEAQAGPVDGIICGHSGVAFERVIDGKTWINAGVIGMPPHDGRPQTRFAVLSHDGVRFHRLSYDAKAASEAMAQAGLIHGYEQSLITGIWPSEDVLPKEMRR